MTLIPKARAKQFVLLVWILVAAFYFYISYDYIRVGMNDGRFSDYMEYLVQLAGNENRSPKEIRTLILVRADELGIPVKANQISVKGSGRTLSIVVDYDIEIDIPIFSRGFYSKHYQHKADYRQNF